MLACHIASSHLSSSDYPSSSVFAKNIDVSQGILFSTIILHCVNKGKEKTKTINYLFYDCDFNAVAMLLWGVVRKFSLESIPFQFIYRYISLVRDKPMTLPSSVLLFTVPMLVTIGMSVLVWFAYALCGNDASDALSLLNPGDDNVIILFSANSVNLLLWPCLAR